jgi:Photosynthetic reaction centre cytochrome C subunit
MKKLIPILFLFVAITSFVSLKNTTISGNKAMKDTLVVDREKILTAMKEDYKDKLASPADSVFKNVNTLKGKSVEQLLSIMNNWGHSLGVTCKFCHDVNDWSSDKSRNYKRTIEMVDMTAMLNKDVFSKLKNFRQPVVMSCIGCHNEMKEPREK